MDIRLNVKRATVDPNNQRMVEVYLEEVDLDEILDYLGISDIVKLKKGELLDEIGEDECIKHFGIKVAEE